MVYDTGVEIPVETIYVTPQDASPAEWAQRTCGHTEVDAVYSMESAKPVAWICTDCSAHIPAVYREPPPDHSWLVSQCTGCRESFPYDADHKCRRWWHRLLH